MRSITGKLDNIGTLQQSVTTLQQDLWDEDGLDERINILVSKTKTAEKILTPSNLKTAFSAKKCK